MASPIPLRTDQLSRERDANRNNRPPVTKGVRRPANWTDPDPEWHDIAKMVWEGAMTSGQADFYQNSDIAQLWMLCEEIDQYKRSKGRYLTKVDDDGEEVQVWLSPKRNAQLLSVIQSMMTNLLMTEGDRRRVRMELDAEPQDNNDAEVIRLQRREQQRAALRGQRKVANDDSSGGVDA